MVTIEIRLCARSGMPSIDIDGYAMHCYAMPCHAMQCKALQTITAHAQLYHVLYVHINPSNPTVSRLRHILLGIDWNSSLFYGIFWLTVGEYFSAFFCIFVPIFIFVLICRRGGKKSVKWRTQGPFRDLFPGPTLRSSVYGGGRHIGIQSRITYYI